MTEAEPLSEDPQAEAVNQQVKLQSLLPQSELLVDLDALNAMLEA
jgi:hypothetical protein